jgi:hypothetical protein
VVDSVTPDNLISAQEAGLQSLPVTGKVSGEFRPGDIVSVLVNNKTVTGTVNEQGLFSVNVPTSDLLADPDTKLEVTLVASDAAGNTSSVSGSMDYNVQTVPAVNVAPVNTVPTSAQTAVGGTAKVIAGLSVNDADSNLSTVKLSVLNGSLNVDLNGATITSGANGSPTLTLSGSQAQINAALATVRYTGNAGFNGVDNLSMVSTDSAGTPLSDTDSVTINVSSTTPPQPVGNVAPVNTVPTSAQTAVGGTAKAIAGLSVNDADSNLSTVKLSVLNGSLNVDLNGATITSGANGRTSTTT